MKKLFWVIFWGLFVIASLALSSGDDNFPLWLQILWSPIILLLAWIILLRFRDFFTSLIRRLPFPAFLKFLIIGSLLAAFLVQFTVCFGVCGEGDLDRNPAINTYLYIGSYLGNFVILYFLRRFLNFGYLSVFWIIGLRGALAEQGSIFPLALLSGDIVGSSLMLFYLIPSYGVATSAIFLIFPKEQLPQNTKTFGKLTQPLIWFLIYLLPWSLGDWIGSIWYVGTDLIFGTNFSGLKGT